jgi:hypothetical protein
MTKKMTSSDCSIDDIDIPLLEGRTIFMNRKGYGEIKLRNKGVLVHRLIHVAMGLDPNLQTDHKNQNKLDCRRENLREATQTQNKANSRTYKNNTSGFKGVSFHKRQKKYNARLRINKEVVHLGCFLDPVDAAKAYDKAAVEYFGEFAFTNKDMGLY